jgi:ABC-type molybdate transport system permease subunit
LFKEHIVELFLHPVLPLAAIGYSLVYLLGGGGFIGAFLIFMVAKMLGD